jgi:hypothetical protein
MVGCVVAPNLIMILPSAGVRRRPLSAHDDREPAPALIAHAPERFAAGLPSGHHSGATAAGARKVAVTVPQPPPGPQPGRACITRTPIMRSTCTSASAPKFQ